MKKKATTLLCGASLLFFAGCNTSIEGKWEMEDTPAGIDATVFLQPGGELAGSTGLNNYFGTYSVGPDNTIVLDAQGMTRKAGSPRDMEFESVFMETLRKVNGYTIEGERLFLKENGNIVAVFEKED